MPSFFNLPIYLPTLRDEDLDLGFTKLRFNSWLCCFLCDLPLRTSLELITYCEKFREEIPHKVLSTRFGILCKW